MEHTYRTMDEERVKWGPGPWDDEPDKIQFVDEATGLPCLIKRNHMGALCGYVGVSEGHPAFDKGYDDVDVHVHGGLTYANFCQEGPEDKAICHIPEPGEPDHVYWLGFDMAHGGDLVPAMTSYYYEQMFGPDEKITQLKKQHEAAAIDGPLEWQDTYKNIGYVRAECIRLAQQLAALTETAQTV